MASLQSSRHLTVELQKPSSWSTKHSLFNSVGSVSWMYWRCAGVHKAAFVQTSRGRIPSRLRQGGGVIVPYNGILKSHVTSPDAIDMTRKLFKRQQTSKAQSSLQVYMPRNNLCIWLTEYTSANLWELLYHKIVSHSSNVFSAFFLSSEELGERVRAILSDINMEKHHGSFQRTCTVTDVTTEELALAAKRFAYELRCSKLSDGFIFQTAQCMVLKNYYTVCSWM